MTFLTSFEVQKAPGDLRKGCSLHINFNLLHGDFNVLYEDFNVLYESFSVMHNKKHVQYWQEKPGGGCQLSGFDLKNIFQGFATRHMTVNGLSLSFLRIWHSLIVWAVQHCVCLYQVGPPSNAVDPSLNKNVRVCNLQKRTSMPIYEQRNLNSAT